MYSYKISLRFYRQVLLVMNSMTWGRRLLSESKTGQCCRLETLQKYTEAESCLKTIDTFELSSAVSLRKPLKVPKLTRNNFLECTLWNLNNFWTIKGSSILSFFFTQSELKWYYLKVLAVLWCEIILGDLMTSSTMIKRKLWNH